ncbi:MAG: hypothetical protein ACR2PL_10900 [Dehalococcoidia bacterium]
MPFTFRFQTKEERWSAELWEVQQRIDQAICQVLSVLCAETGLYQKVETCVERPGWLVTGTGGILALVVERNAPGIYLHLTHSDTDRHWRHSPYRELLLRAIAEGTGQNVLDFAGQAQPLR